MYKVISSKRQKTFDPLQKEAVILSMIKNAGSIKANYNNRLSDSISAKHFKHTKVKDVESNATEEEGGLYIDLFNADDTAKAYILLLQKGNTILECSTYLQMLFFMAIFENATKLQLQGTLNKLSKDTQDSFLFLIKPFCTKPCESEQSFFSFEDFAEVEEYEDKIDARKVDCLENGDIVYIENYDVYPTELNGAYSGEWAIVIDDSSKKNPTLYGFGIGVKSYFDIKGILKNACIQELINNHRSPKLIDRRDKVGISCRMKINLFV